jgi:phosphoribosylformimino-5-aminoimidazole carboxamide ribotide isomerase
MPKDVTEQSARSLIVKILPVIDLKGGLVVRGVAGKREEYRPVVSKLTSDATPRGVARAFRELVGAKDVYVADLDAIGGAEPDWKSLEQIAVEGLKVWLDCGVGNVERAKLIAEYASRSGSLAAIVVGLESVAETSDLAEVFSVVGPALAVFSLDLREGAPLTTVTQWQDMMPKEIARRAVEIGFKRLIVLDLAQVGVGQGPNVAPLCRELRETIPNIELTAGGGVRGPLDLSLLAAAGCDRVLVASALHDGVLSSV